MEGGRRAGGAGYGHGKEVVGRQPEPEPEPDIIWLFTAKYEPLPMVFQLHTPCTVLSIFRTQKKRDLVVAHQDRGPKTPLTKGNDSNTRMTLTLTLTLTLHLKPVAITCVHPSRYHKVTRVDEYHITLMSMTS